MFSAVQVTATVAMVHALTSPADRSIRQGSLMQDEQILLERTRLQAAKALVSLIDEDRDVLTPNGCPYKDKKNGRRVGL
jgi:hypothetical protein